eukprot:790430-Prorocentrum_minimum.AAC.2
MFGSRRARRDTYVARAQQGLSLSRAEVPIWLGLGLCPGPEVARGHHRQPCLPGRLHQWT